MRTSRPFELVIPWLLIMLPGRNVLPDFDFLRDTGNLNFLYGFLICKCCQFIPIKEKATKNNKNTHCVGQARQDWELDLAHRLSVYSCCSFFLYVYTITQNTVIATKPTAASAFILCSRY